MERPGGSGQASPLNVPSFLSKLWKLVDDPATDALISWSPSGSSFLVYDQVQFANNLLPLYFKHNHMASFIRQLNMYGFHKVVHFPQGLMKKVQREPIEYQHPDFLRGHEPLLENIRRKVASASGAGAQHSLAGLCHHMQMMKEKQENMDLQLSAVKFEADTLRLEVTALQQTQAQQHRVISKLGGFLMVLAKSSQLSRFKKKVPQLMIGSPSAPSPPKCCCRDHLHHDVGGHAPGPSSSGLGALSPPAAAHSLFEPAQAAAEVRGDEPVRAALYKKESCWPPVRDGAQMEGPEPARALRAIPAKGQPRDEAPASGMMGGPGPAPRQPASQ